MQVPGGSASVSSSSGSGGSSDGGIGGACGGGGGSSSMARSRRCTTLTGMEQSVATAWAAVLQIDVATIEPFHTLVDLGGDSLTTLRVVRQLHAVLGVDLDLKSKEGRVGELDGVLSPRSLLQTPRLDHYAALLDRTFGSCRADGNGGGGSGSTEHSNAAPVAAAAAAAAAAPFPASGGGNFGGDGGNALDAGKRSNYETREDGEEEKDEDEDEDDDDKDEDGVGLAVYAVGAVPIRLVEQARIASALMSACKRGLMGTAAVLLRVGADSCGGIAARSHGYSPLHAACANGHLHIVTMLLANGARINGTTAAKVTGAHSAAGAGELAVLVALLEAGCSAKIRDANKQGLLHHAARHGRASVCNYLLAPPHALDPDASDRWHRSPLHWAVVNGHPGAVKALLAGGADPNFAVRASVHKRATTLLQESILHIALRNAAVALIVGHGTSADAAAAAAAAAAGAGADGGGGGNEGAAVDIVRILIQAGAAKDTEDENSASAFDAATAYIAFVTGGNGGGSAGIEKAVAQLAELCDPES